MRDTKSTSLLIISSILLLVSIGLLCSLGYQYYLQAQRHQAAATEAVPAPTTATVSTDSVPTSIQNNTRDSLLNIYNLTVNSIDSRLDTAAYAADSIKGNLDNNLKEFYKLRTEIAALLQNKNSSTDITLAQQKIEELQQTVTQLRYRNTDVENENKKLYALLAQLTKQLQNNDQSSKPVPTDNSNAVATRAVLNTIISAGNLNLAAVANDDTQETSEARQTEKLVGSFTVKNQGTTGKCDIIVVVLQPDGHVLQKSAWESGAFETKEGKKIYSCKFRCDAPKGESKPLSFSITADTYQKGNYTMQIYHNGVLIAKRYKMLS
jgi:hypothetical protein